MPEAGSLIDDETPRRVARCLERAGIASAASAALDIGGLGFAERSAAVGEAFLADMPDDPERFAASVRKLAADPEFTGWLIWPVGIAVTERSLAAGTAKAFDTGLDLLALLTTKLTCEAALRPFLDADLDSTIATAMDWTASGDEGVRRLASEGTRPLLPWAPRSRAVLANPEATIPLLDALYRDESETVRRSVANHLNDISRAEPDLAVATVRGWLARPDENTGRTAAHALRTLVKDGHAAALRLLGFAPADDLEIEGPLLAAATVEPGGNLDFTVRIANPGEDTVRLAVDYVVHYRKANGTLAPKVFKLRVLDLPAGETVELGRSRSFKPISTRRFHPGEHAIEVQVNGQRYGLTSFTLTG